MKSLFICFILVAATDCIAQNVGIGTTTPKVKLHVVKGVPLVDPYLGSTMALQTDGETMLHILSGGNLESGSIVFGNNQQLISAGIQFNTFTPNDLTFFTNASLPTFTMNNLGNIGIHTVDPKAAFNVGAGKTVLFGADTTSGTEGGKMIWYSSKSAFRVGYSYQDAWDYGNVGYSSLASGFGSKASGPSSTAMGAGCIASSHGTTALGNGTIASGLAATAMGDETTASGFSSTAMGSGTVASGSNSTTMGSVNTASGGNSTAMGFETLASGAYSTAMGFDTKASGNTSIASGSFTTAKSFNETSFGAYNTDYTPASTTTWSANDRLFVLGNGTAPGARSDAMVVLKNGNTGIGISSPNAPLQFATSNQKRKIVLFETANNDNQFFGFGVFAGELRYQTGVATDDHVFYTAASSNSSNELMRIKGNGNVGIGTSAPNAALQFSNNTANRKIVFYEGANNDHQFNGFGLNAGVLRYQVNNTSDDHVFYAGASATTSNELVRIKGNGNVGIGKNNPGYKLDVVGDINASGQVRANGIALTSDARFKQNISTIPNALNSLLQLRGTKYFFNTQSFPERNFSSDKQLGVIAQEVEKIFPELVTTDKEGYKSVNYIGLIPVMIESIKEQQMQIEKQNQQIEKLTQVVNQLLNK